MSLRRAALLAMTLAAIAATLGPAGLAVAADPTPLPPDQAQALATAPADRAARPRESSTAKPP